MPLLFELDQSLTEEQYKIQINPKQIIVVASTLKGAFYAIKTLQQILKEDKIPCMEIDDYPDLKLRGVMLDISRSKVPTLSTLKKLVEIQYERNDIDFSRGKFRVKGDTLDIFPTNTNENIVRVDFFGDEIESITRIDQLTGEISSLTWEIKSEGGQITTGKVNYKVVLGDGGTILVQILSENHIIDETSSISFVDVTAATKDRNIDLSSLTSEGQIASLLAAYDISFVDAANNTLNYVKIYFEN